MYTVSLLLFFYCIMSLDLTINNISMQKTKTKNTKESFLKLIREVFKDIFFLYRNFFHWNASKIIIRSLSAFLWLVFSLPFILVIIILWFLDPIEWWKIFSSLSEGRDITNILRYNIDNHPIYLFIELLLSISIIWTFFLGFSYYLPLEARLYLEYSNSKKPKIFKNKYFSKDLIKKHIFITFKISLLLLIPFLIFFFLKDKMIWNSLSSVFWMILFMIFLYLIYRTGFSYITLIDKDKYKKTEKSRFYFKESLFLTKWKVVFRFIMVFFIVSLIFIPYRLVSSELSNRENTMVDYLKYRKIWNSESLTVYDKTNYELLKLFYSDKSDEEVSQQLVNNYKLQLAVLPILYFLFLSWIISMTFVSFYKKQLTI